MCKQNAIYRRVAIIFIFSILISGCGNAAPTHSTWVEADALFRAKERFRGADSAYSADLGDARILWLFGDTFIGSSLGSRDSSTLVRNSIAIQNGYNPETASIDFYTGDENGKATAFVSNIGETWLWPGPAIKVADKLLLTFFELERQEDVLGFKAIGSAAFLVSNPDATPPDWDFEPLTIPPMPPDVRFGTGALLHEGKYLFAFLVTEPGNHDVYLARWKTSDIHTGDLSSPEWFDSEAGWRSAIGGITPIIKNVQTEFSVHRDADTSKLWLVSVDGFGSTNIVKRTAHKPEGPWSKPQLIARPEESDRGNVLVYSAKAHPYLTGGESTITYCTNSLDFGTLVRDMSIYFPRFLRKR